ncbi:MAG: class I SAM-dependent methyltransferase [Armatimonadaceae bacterium]
MANDYKPFFENMTPEAYLSEGFTGNTEAEVAFLEEALGLRPGTHLLDMGCGPGRHSLALAERGFQVTGVDFTPQFIEYAAAKAAERNVAKKTEFVLADAREFVRPLTFDGAICVCEGAFALLAEDADNRKVLKNIADSLKNGAQLVLTTLNGYRSIRRAGTDGETTLDPITMVETWNPATQGGDAIREPLPGRHYIVPELIAMHRECGLTVLHVWGGTAGNWNRQPLDWDEMEIMLVSRKIPQ